MHTVSWSRMEDGSKDDYEFLGAVFEEQTKGALVDNLFGILRLLEGPTLGYRIDRYRHCLQSATRAHRAGESTELVVAALLHDIGDAFAPDNHSAAAADLLAPYVSEATEWIVRHHGIFQGYYYFHHLGGDRHARDRYSGSPHYEACVHFCAEYDQNCFDPDYDTLPLEEFDPMVREIFARPSRLADPAIAD